MINIIIFIVHRVITGPVTDPEQEPRFLEMTKLNFDKAATYTSIDKGVLEVIKACNSLVRVSFPLRRDDGSIEVCAAEHQPHHQRRRQGQPRPARLSSAAGEGHRGARRHRAPHHLVDRQPGCLPFPPSLYPPAHVPVILPYPPPPPTLRSSRATVLSTAITACHARVVSVMPLMWTCKRWRLWLP